MREITGTRWSMIQAAADGSEEAYAELVAKYRPAVLAYIRSRGQGGEAEDLTQEVFLRLVRDGVLSKANPTRGSFRGLLSAVSRHVIGHHHQHRGAAKRGAGKDPLPLDDKALAAPAPDEGFDREWLRRLFELALQRLEREHPRYFEAVRLFFVEGRTRQEVAQALDRSPGDVRNHVFRGKRKLISYIREEVWSYSTTNEAYAEELRWLGRFLGD